MNTSGLRSSTLVIASGMFSCLWCVSGWAQQSAATSPAATEDNTKLEEVVVTAERRSTDVEKTPIVIDTVQGSELQQAAKNDINEVLRTVPGVQIQGGPFAGAVYIRGLGPTLTTDPSVNVAVDDVYQTDGFIDAVFDVDRVEVLKGPQGTLYGRNATAGAVNLITHNPTETFGATGSVEYGNYDLVHTESSINIPMAPGLDFRAAAMTNQHQGYMSNGGMDADDTAARAKLLYQPSDALSLLISTDFAHIGGHGNSQTPVSHSSAQFQYWIASNETRDLSNPPDPCWCTTVPAGRQDSRKYGVSARLDWKLPWATLTYIPAWYRFYENFDGAGPVPGALLATEDVNQQVTHELRLASADQTPKALKWLVGFYYIDYKSNNAGPFAAALAPDGTDGNGVLYTHGAPSAQNEYNPLSQTKSYAPFAQITLPVTDTFRVTGGIRYTHDTKSEKSVWTDANDVILANAVVGTPSVTTTAVTWKGGLEYDVSDKSLLYGDVSTGYKAGGFNAVVSNQNPANPISATNPVTAWNPILYKPEHITAYELGSKSRFLDDRLQVNADVYYYAYRDIQEFTITFPLPGGSQPPQPLAFNAGKSHADGVELEAEFAATRSDRFTASVDYNNTRFDDFVYPSVLYGNQVRTGSPWVLAPKWQEMIGYDHIFQLTGGSTITASIQPRFSSSYITTIEPNPDVYQPAFHKTDAHLTYASADSKLSVTAFIDNIEDVPTRQFVFGFIPGPQPPTVGLYQTQLAPPRTYGVQISAKL